jgi:hypothetical protein
MKDEMKLIIQRKSSSINLGNRRIKKKKKANEKRYFMWSMIIVLIGLYLDHVCKKKKRKDPPGYIRHLTARSLSTISNWCRRLQAACALAVLYTLNSIFFTVRLC